MKFISTQAESIGVVGFRPHGHKSQAPMCVKVGRRGAGEVGGGRGGEVGGGGGGGGRRGGSGEGW